MTYAVISSLLGDVQPSFSARLLKTRQLLKLELNFCREVENVLVFFGFFLVGKKSRASGCQLTTRTRGSRYLYCKLEGTYFRWKFGDLHG